MRTQALAVGLLLLTAVGCAQPSPKEDEEQPELGPELQALVLEQAPSDVPNPTFVDFGGKVALIGYALEPARLAAPGSKLTLKLFWRSMSELGESYRVYTELVTPGGKRFPVEGRGPVRQGALKPSTWESGKIYIDELDITVPEELDAARFSIVVGLKTAPVAPEEPAAVAKGEAKDEARGEPSEGNFGDVYLSVLSGLSDAKHGGVVATLETGVVPGAKRARTGKDEKRQLVGNKRPASALGKSPLPLRPPRDPGRRPTPAAAPAPAPAR